LARDKSTDAEGCVLTVIASVKSLTGAVRVQAGILGSIRPLIIKEGRA
jgi:hypothetical protein